MLYSYDSLKILAEQIKNIINEPLSKELFFSTLIYPVIDTSIEGDNFKEELECNHIPSFIICKYKNNESLAIIGKLELPIKLGDLRDKIIESELSYIKKPSKEKNNNNINNSSNHNNIKNENTKIEYEPNYADYDFGDEDDFNFDDINKFQDLNNMKLSDGQILAFQELKLKELEKIEEKKKFRKEKNFRRKRRIKKNSRKIKTRT